MKRESLMNKEERKIILDVSFTYSIDDNAANQHPTGGAAEMQRTSPSSPTSSVGCPVLGSMGMGDVMGGEGREIIV